MEFYKHKNIKRTCFHCKKQFLASYLSTSKKPNKSGTCSNCNSIASWLQVYHWTIYTNTKLAQMFMKQASKFHKSDSYNLNKLVNQLNKEMKNGLN